MQCDVCHSQDAVIFVQQVAGTRTVGLHLCSDCAQKRGIMASSGSIEFSVSNLLSGLLEDSEKKYEALPDCPFCGMSQAELKKTNTLGCEHCASHFNQDIKAILRKISPNTNYNGRYPASLKIEKMDEHKKLLIQLKRALEQERYEDAVSIRDSIRLLDKGNE